MAAKQGRMTWRQGLIFLAVVSLIVVLDQVTKEWIRVHIAVGGALPEMGRLTIVHIQNTGSAFGLFPNSTIFLSIVAIAGLVVILFLFRYLRELGFAGGIALSLVFAGALGNQIDRFRLGHVTDFIYIRLWGNFFWPAFNIADSAITVGAISLAIIAMVRLSGSEKTAIKAGEKDGTEPGKGNKAV